MMWEWPCGPEGRSHDVGMAMWTRGEASCCGNGHVDQRGGVMMWEWPCGPERRRHDVGMDMWTRGERGGVMMWEWPCGPEVSCGNGHVDKRGGVMMWEWPCGPEGRCHDVGMAMWTRGEAS
ncbi:hypothetical protein ACOMHN_040401 [Nucella lapillus]